MGDDELMVASAEQLAQAAPQPHERVVYWGSGSPQAWRVLIALEEKQLKWRSVCVSFSSGVLKSPFFAALNPRLRIPVLVEPVDTDANTEAAVTTKGDQDDPLRLAERTIVYESGAILEFLERKYPTRPCMPRELPLFAVAQTRLHEANEILSVVGDLVVYLRRFPPEKRNAAVVDAKWALLEAELNLWEAYLAGEGQQYLVDKTEPFLCDFTLFTNIAYAVRCGLQLDGLYPRLACFYVRLCQRASVEATWPPHWKTTFGSKVLTKCFYCAGKPHCSCCPPALQPAPAPAPGSSGTSTSAAVRSHQLTTPPSSQPQS
ncbi:TPA: hypothetical protein N0F65_011490 [Lagenidium giganteum]|uniref:GST N-terminal domain-containing protein n=1 Tax=Lagenidium giganteum TaxID=4803 RepID=A0AAV2YI69_9STRA|nr:TPA: hypothetical protein N0F65_011490 [Lagenidium giganteum]